MDTEQDAYYEKITGRMKALEAEHRAAVESGDKTQAQTLLAKSKALYMDGLEGTKKVMGAVKATAEAKATLFELGLKAATRRMERLNSQRGLSEGEG